jgi:hypothetical protein
MALKEWRKRVGDVDEENIKKNKTKRETGGREGKM